MFENAEEIDIVNGDIPLDDVHFTVIHESIASISFTCNQHKGTFTINDNSTTMYTGSDRMCRSSPEFVRYVCSIFYERYQNNNVSYNIA